MSRYKFPTLLSCCVLIFQLFASQSYAWDMVPTRFEPGDDKIHYINVNPDSISDSFLVESNGQYLLGGYQQPGTWPPAEPRRWLMIRPM